MIDTHPDIMNSICSVFFYPCGEHGCKFSKECAAVIKRSIQDDQHWVKKKHEEYLTSIEHLAKK
jgi:hypothetical protein